MGWLEQRIQNLEELVRSFYRRLLDLQQQINALKQRMQSDGGGSPSDSGGAGYFACTLSLSGGTLAHGTPGTPATGQAVWRVENGARAQVTAAGKIYNDGPNAADDISDGKTVILAQNRDGTYCVIGVYC